MVGKLTKFAAIALVGSIIGGASAMAQTNPSPNAPTAKGNQIPGPSATRPTDPAANDTPSARPSTAPTPGPSNGGATAQTTTTPSSQPPDTKTPSEPKDKSGAGGTPKTGN